MAKRRDLEQTSFLYGGNGSFIEELYARYLTDPGSVDPAGGPISTRWSPRTGPCSSAPARPWSRDLPISGWSKATPLHPGEHSIDDPRVKALIHDHLRVIMLIRAFRVRGHLIAKLDPLGLTRNDQHPELDYHTYGFTDADLDREFYLDFVLGPGEGHAARRSWRSCRRPIAARSASSSCTSRTRSRRPGSRRGSRARAGLFTSSAEDKLEILEQLTETEGFEQFLHVKFPGTKRFALDGGESSIPPLDTIIRTRGRARRPRDRHRHAAPRPAQRPGQHPAQALRAIFTEFEGNLPETVRARRREVPPRLLGRPRDARRAHVHLSLTPNPSHLEAVNPVVEGRCGPSSARRRHRAQAAACRS